MAKPTPVVATAVSLRLEPESWLRAGSGLRLTATPDAQAIARTVLGTDPTVTEALAVGLGAGTSPYYQVVEQANKLLSPGLTIESGSALIDGIANAFASATGLGPTGAKATALQTGLAGINWRSNYAGNIDVGINGSPLTAKARVVTGTMIPPAAGVPLQPSNLDATARVRGIESSMVLGQPNAVVSAESTLDLTYTNADLIGNASADAIGLDNVLAKVTTFGNANDTRLGGVARSTVTLELPSPPSNGLSSQQLRGPAIGINRSDLIGSPSLNTTFRGEGLATIELQVVDAFGNPTQDSLSIREAQQTSAVSDLRGIGINNSTIRSGTGDATVIARGGVFDHGLPYNGVEPASDGLLAAGFNNSVVATNSGNDYIFGKLLRETDVYIDVNGDGIYSKEQFLVHDSDSTTVGAQADRFNGIRNSTINTGSGDDLVEGDASGSWIFTQAGNNTINLDHARDSSLWGGYQRDNIRVGDESKRVVFWGNLGEDTISGAQSGVGNVFDGGLQSDLISGTAGASDQFLLTDANASLTAASTLQVNQLLTNSAFWKDLCEEGKQELWLTGRVTNSAGTDLGSVDVIGSDGQSFHEFESGNGGDQLVINSAIGNITQELWDCYGAVYEVNDVGRISLFDAGGATPQPSKGIAVVVGTLDNIRRLGIGVSSLAYATDTRQLMFDADTNWQNGGSLTMGTINTNGPLRKSNIAFGSTTGSAMGVPSTAPSL
jgi:hypothetical protein